MKKFNVSANFNGQVSQIHVYIGAPEKSHNPIHFQAEWLQNVRGGNIFPEVMDAIGKLHEISLRNNIPLDELCLHSVGESGSLDDLIKEKKTKPKKPTK